MQPQFGANFSSQLFPESGPFPAAAAGDNASAYQRKHQESRTHWLKYLDSLVYGNEPLLESCLTLPQQC